MDCKALYQPFMGRNAPSGIKNKQKMPRNNKKDKLPAEVASILDKISNFFDTMDEKGRKVCDSQYGVYAFFDYDAEPIYVGQTYEKLRVRIRRHLTNQRTDAVAMSVLDPFEVAEIEVWPLDDQVKILTQDIGKKEFLARAEYTVFKRVLKASTLGAVLNEKEIVPKKTVDLPRSYRCRIVPDDVFKIKKHPDIRIARRANTIANLARVVSERNVSDGLRQTLLTQARRLELLASKRIDELGIKDPAPRKVTGEKD